MIGPVRILIVSSDSEISDTLAARLSFDEAFRVGTLRSGDEALSLFDDDWADVILLDEELPMIDGAELCRIMRSHDINVPVILMSRLASDANVILALEAGANDYVSMPTQHLGVLLARIRVQLRQYVASEHAIFHFGPYLFRPAQRLLRNRNTGAQISLRGKECKILNVLCRAEEKVISSEQLYYEVWGHAIRLNTHTLATHIYHLRSMIETVPANPRFLLSKSGGYCITH